MATPATPDTLAQTKNTTKKKVWICIIGSIMILLYSLYSHSSSKKTSNHSSPTTHLIHIYTDKWTVVEINGRKSKWYPPIVNGELRSEIRYLVALNNLNSIPKEMPRKSSLDLQGVKILYFSLIPGQGITNAEIRIDLE